MWYIGQQSLSSKDSSAKNSFASGAANSSDIDG